MDGDSTIESQGPNYEQHRLTSAPASRRRGRVGAEKHSGGNEPHRPSSAPAARRRGVGGW
ncbi:MAG: hypothetical protein JXA37_04025 [Chloroflexia bacterium]|nr:hypothetical protein [Chloroflexia bacterium]